MFMYTNTKYDECVFRGQLFWIFFCFCFYFVASVSQYTHLVLFVSIKPAATTASKLFLVLISQSKTTFFFVFCFFLPGPVLVSTLPD